ncbi:MAG: MoaD/ThiS family protein [Streptosporangiales bacterium]
MHVTVVVPGALRRFADGRSRMEVELPGDATLGELLARLADECPALHRRIQDETGALRRHVNVFVGETNVRDARLLDTGIPAGADVVVLPAVSGG